MVELSALAQVPERADERFGSSAVEALEPIRRSATSGRWSEAISAWRVRGSSTLRTSTWPS